MDMNALLAVVQVRILSIVEVPAVILALLLMLFIINRGAEVVIQEDNLYVKVQFVQDVSMEAGIPLTMTVRSRVQWKHL